MSIKVLLINPSITQAEVYAQYSEAAPCLPPLGLCYLAAVLLEKEYETKIIDCVAESLTWSQLEKEIQSFNPDLVGVTSTTVSYETARSLLQDIKEMNPEIKTALGGAHLSALPSTTMEECPSLDIGVFGEGEYTLLEIVRRLERAQSLAGVEGAIVRINGKLVENKPREPLKCLDEIPFPARHLLKDLRMYSHTPFRGAKFMTTMVTSRGCPFQCGFCDQSVFGRIWRYHSAEYVVEEMSLLHKEYGVDFISVEDDNFMLSKARTAAVCQKIIKKDLRISWSCLGHTNEVDEEVLPLMKEAGCRTIYLGIESGSSRILELINKNVSLEGIRESVECIKKYGIDITGSFIFGLPTETREDMERTIDFALSLPLDGVTFFVFTPYPNTPLRDLAFQHGRVSKDWKDYSGHPNSLPFVPDGIDQEYLLDIQRRAYKKFLLRPRYLIRNLGTFTNRQTMRKGIKFLKGLIAK